MVITDDYGRITRFLEKPSWSEVFSDTVNTGIYVLEPEALRLFDAGVQFDFSKNLFPLILKKGLPLFGYVACGYWSDVGNIEQYRQTHYDILQGSAQVKMCIRDRVVFFSKRILPLSRSVMLSALYASYSFIYLAACPSKIILKMCIRDR